MSYTARTDWKTGDLVTPADMSRIEQGIDDAHTAITDIPRPPTNPETVRLSDFPGNNDDQRLANAMAYCAARTYKGTTIWLDENRLYTFQQQHVIYDGFSIRGAGRPQDQARGSMPLGARVNMRMTGGWFVLPEQSQTFGCSWSNLSLDGTSSSRLIDGHSSRVLWTSNWRDISCQNASGVIGGPSTKLLVTACSIDGWWNVNNVRDVAIHWGGSDNKVAPTQFLLDSPPNLRSSTSYLLRLNGLSKTPFYNFYITADQWRGIEVSSSGSLISFNGFVIEGRNANTPCYGSLVRLTGNSRLIIRDSFLAYAMSDPDAISTSQNRGVIDVSAGTLVMDGVEYRRANGVSQDVPLVYISGGTGHVVKNVIAAYDTWTSRPKVIRTSDAIPVHVDDTVELVTL